MKLLLKSLLIFVFVTSVSLAQQDNKKDAVETAVSKLQQKVLLSDQQASDVRSIIMSNLDDLQNSSTQGKALNDSKGKVEALLDSRQKAKYSIIKDDWWNNLIKSIES